MKTCYVCKKPCFIEIPETTNSNALFVPCCNKCYATYSAQGHLEDAALKYENLELLQSIIEKCVILKYDINAAVDFGAPLYQMEQVLELLYKLEKNLEKK